MHPPQGIIEFNEATYLEAFSDISELVQRKDVPTGLIHYLATGRAERRLANPNYLLALAGGVPERAGHGELSVNLEAAFCSPAGECFLSGGGTTEPIHC